MFYNMFIWTTFVVYYNLLHGMGYGWNLFSHTPNGHYEIGNPHLLDGLGSLVP